jgi:hypothetical protein
MDGDVNYSQFSRASLEEALTNIDKQKYPRNYANLLNELNGRPPSPPNELSIRDWSKFVDGIGWYLLASSVIFAHELLTSDLSGIFKSWHLFWTWSAILGLSLLTAAAGVLTVRHHRVGTSLCIASFAAQVVALGVVGFKYKYSPLFAVRLFWEGGNFGFHGVIGPEIAVTTDAAGPAYFGIDVLAIAAIVVLVKYVRRRGSVS